MESVAESVIDKKVALIHLSNALDIVDNEALNLGYGHQVNFGAKSFSGSQHNRKLFKKKDGQIHVSIVSW